MNQYKRVVVVGCLLLAASLGAFAQSKLPVAWYSFDDENQVGRNIMNGLNGELTNVTSVRGVRGRAAHFDNGWIMLPSSPLLDLNPGDFTLSVFVRTTIAASNRNWFTKATVRDHYYGLSTGPDGTVAITFEGNTAAGFALSTTNVSDGNWHHVAAIKRGDRVEIWVDGRFESSGMLNLTFSVDDSPAQFAIGRDGACCEFFNGDMDEAKIWNRALSAKEIAVEAEPISNRSCVVTRVDFVGVP